MGAKGIPRADTVPAACSSSGLSQSTGVVGQTHLAELEGENVVRISKNGRCSPRTGSEAQLGSWGPEGAREETLCLPGVHGLRLPLLPIPVDQASLPL